MQLDCGLQALGGHMGTYTTNYNLFMPSVGETGWGELVNGNFTTIDTTMKELDTRVGTTESNITSIRNELGTCLKYVTVPIYVKCSSTDIGCGTLLIENTNEHTIPDGYSVTNPTEVQGDAGIKLFNNYNQPHSGTVNARNVFTGATRTLGTPSVGGITTATCTYSLQFGEVFYMTNASYLQVRGYVRPAIYAGTV